MMNSKLKTWIMVFGFVPILCLSMIPVSYAHLDSDDNYDGLGKLLSLITHRISFKENETANENGCPDADPIDMFSGEFIRRETDLVIPEKGSLNVNIVRTYRSKKSYNGAYGYNWFFNYHVRVMKLVSGHYLLLDGRGFEHIYLLQGQNPQGENIYKSKTKDNVLIEHLDGTKTLIKKNGLRYSFNFNGCLTQILDRNNNFLQFEYYQEQGVDKKVPILGKSKYFVTQESGIVVLDFQLKKIIDPLGREIILNYYTADDGLKQGRVKEIIDFIGRKISYDYNDEGDLIAFTSQSTSAYPDGLSMTYTYSTGFDSVLLNHNLLTVADSKGQIYIDNTYNENDMINHQEYGEGAFEMVYGENGTSITDRNGNVKEFAFNSTGNPISEKVYTQSGSPSFYETQTSYDDKMDVLKTILPQGNVIDRKRDPNGNIIEIRKKQSNQDDSPDDIVYTFTYEPIFNNLKSYTDPKGYTYTLTFDYQEGEDYTGLASKIGKTASEVQTMLTDSGIPMNLGDVNGDGTITQINGNVIKTESPEVTQGVPSPQQSERIVTYNSFGQVLSVTNALGISTLYGYDVNSYLNQVASDAGGLNISTGIVRDAVGNVTSITDPKGNTTTLEINDLNQVTKIISPTPFNYETCFTYDENGNVVQIDKATGNPLNPWQTVIAEYNILDKIKKIRDELGNETLYTYDPEENILSITDAENHTTTYTYNEREQIKTVTDALSQLTTYNYNDNGRLSSILDANSNETIYAYDLFDRISTVTYPDSSIKQYGYDKNSNLISFMTRNNETITYTYDEINRMYRKEYPDASNVNYVYDVLGRLSSITKSGSSIEYFYDNLNRVLSSTTNGKTIGYEYDNNSNRTKIIYPDNLAEISYQYDNLNRLTDIKDQSSQTIAHYNYNPLNLIETVQYLNGISTNYSFDDLSRLTQIASSLSTVGYTYDKVGNRKSMVNPQGTHNYVYDDIYQLTNITGVDTQTFNYDPLGNRENTIIEGSQTDYTKNNLNQYTDVGGTAFHYDNNGNLTNNGNHTFSYDVENRLLSVNANISYEYDGFGRRKKKTVDSTTTNFLYDADNLLVEYDANWVPIRWYVNSDGIDNQITLNTSTDTYYYHKDGLGSVTHITDGNGDVVEKYEYSPFGKVTIKDSSNNVIPETTIGNHFLFTGRSLDNETGLYNYRARYYDAEIGRFLSNDPLGYYDSMNLYGYCFNSPNNWVDPFGLTTDIMPPPARLPGYIVPDFGKHNGILTDPIIEIVVEIITYITEPLPTKCITYIQEIFKHKGYITKEGKEYPKEEEKAGVAKPLRDWLEDKPELLEEAEEWYKNKPEWFNIDPDKTPVTYVSPEKVDEIRKKPAESPGHHPHGLALGGPEGQKLTPTNETRTKKNPVHSAVTALQRKIIRAIKGS